MNNTKEKIMFRRFIPHIIAIAGFSLLAGCETVAGLPSVPKAQRLPLNGRPFVIGSVTVSPNAHPKGDIDEHCLPDSMYAQMLKYEMQIGFQHAKLGEGTGTPVPVDVDIGTRFFVTGMGFGTSKIDATVSLDNKVKVGHVGIADGDMFSFMDFGPYWTRQKRVVPSVALAVTNGVKAIKDGKNFGQQHQLFNGNISSDYWASGILFTNTVNKEGLHEPMTVADMEKATGKTKQQLAAICKARIKAAN